jgi:hypothetical protein
MALPSQSLLEPQFPTSFSLHIMPNSTSSLSLSLSVSLSQQNREALRRPCALFFFCVFSPRRCRPTIRRTGGGMGADDRLSMRVDLLACWISLQGEE